jgi:glycine/D-amino acid oxidase-like deaminating enzyme
VKKRIIVVGAGIIGASIAWHLAKAGAEVTIVEAGDPGGVATDKCKLGESENLFSFAHTFDGRMAAR